MTITYSFKITGINKLTLYVDENNNRFENVITKIDFYYSGTDEDNITAIYNSSVILPKPSSNDYKNYNSLIESDIISWLETLINPEELTLMQSVISSNIDNIKTKADSLPWTT